MEIEKLADQHQLNFSGIDYSRNEQEYGKQLDTEMCRKVGRQLMIIEQKDSDKNILVIIPYACWCFYWQEKWDDLDGLVTKRIQTSFGQGESYLYWLSLGNFKRPISIRYRNVEIYTEYANMYKSNWVKNFNQLYGILDFEIPIKKNCALTDSKYVPEFIVALFAVITRNNYIPLTLIKNHVSIQETVYLLQFLGIDVYAELARETSHLIEDELLCKTNYYIEPLFYEKCLKQNEAYKELYFAIYNSSHPKLKIFMEKNAIATILENTKNN